MNPDVNQHLSSINRVISDVILPELSDKPFAREQATLICACLGLLLEVQESQFDYVRQEYEDLHSLLAVWGCETEVERYIGSDLSNEPRDFKYMKASLPELQAVLRNLMETSPPPAESKLGTLLRRYVARQLERETSWLRKTGFIDKADEVPDIGQVLARQASSPL